MTMSVDYVINKQCDLHLMTGPHAGETVKAVPGLGLSEEEVHAWPERAVRHLIDSGTMSRVSSAVDVKELVRSAPSAGVERDGVSDVPISFGPSGERLPEPEEETAEPEAEPTAEATAAAEEPTEFPHPLGGNKFLLSDGSEVSGRQKAVRAQAALEG